MKSLLNEFHNNGYVLLSDVYPKSLMSEIKEEFYRHESEFIAIQKKQGVYEKVIDATHHSLLLCRGMLRLLEPNKLTQFLDLFFLGQKYILNTMGLSKIRPNGKVYTQNIHRDVRSFHGATQLWINALIMLDDSTRENGATWVMSGSEKLDQRPSESVFFESAHQVEGNSGDVLIFHGGIWHCAGENKTKDTRHIITPFFSRPFIKQQLDYPRAFGIDFSRNCSEHLKQILGYNSLIPSTLEEFYQVDENRFYKRSQG
jgi:ectoine hydroxylase-related dioxygenase (phytanoyl-CoA dioxygenase family)